MEYGGKTTTAIILDEVRVFKLPTTFFDWIKSALVALTED
jgi:hypothetical protein